MVTCLLGVIVHIAMRLKACKWHQTSLLDFDYRILRTRRSRVRISPGAPLSPSSSVSCRLTKSAPVLAGPHCHEKVTGCGPRTLSRWLVPNVREPDGQSLIDTGVSFPGLRHVDGLKYTSCR